MADVTMPQLGETVTEGTITKWFKQVGEQVAEDEVLFEVSTDKVDSEVPSPAGGYVAEIKVPEGETVDVGAVLAVIESKGAAPAAPAAPSAPAASAPATAPARPAPAPSPAPAPAPAPAASARITPSQPGERDTAVPFSNIRKRTAEHMVRSKQTSAHVYASIEVEYEAVEQVRRVERGS